jgi:hypothetical protein
MTLEEFLAANQDRPITEVLGVHHATPVARIRMSGTTADIAEHMPLGPFEYHARVHRNVAVLGEYRVQDGASTECVGFFGSRYVADPEGAASVASIIDLIPTYGLTTVLDAIRFCSERGRLPLPESWTVTAARLPDILATWPPVVMTHGDWTMRYGEYTTWPLGSAP